MRLYVTKELMKRAWNKKNRSLVWEVSELDGRFDDFSGPARRDSKGKLHFDSVEVINVETENHKVFFHTHNDMNSDEIAGWNYKSEDGIRLLLIND